MAFRVRKKKGEGPTQISITSADEGTSDTCGLRMTGGHINSASIATCPSDDERKENRCNKNSLTNVDQRARRSKERDRSSRPPAFPTSCSEPGTMPTVLHVQQQEASRNLLPRMPVDRAVSDAFHIHRT